MGVRAALIANTAKPQEMTRLVEEAKATRLILPRRFHESKLAQELEERNFESEIIETTNTVPHDWSTWTNAEVDKGHEALEDSRFREQYEVNPLPANQGTILYTSGTTGRPKGVFTDIPSLTRQCTGLRISWNYTPSDHILHVLPNHHIHGLVNCLLTPLSSGSSIEFISQPFNAHRVLSRLSQPPSDQFPQVTMFHGVPTMYAALTAAYDSSPPSKQSEISSSLRRLRVAVCGSAALPVPIAEKWKKITGSIPLERYGMTETGMALSNPLDPSLRKLGSVGYPMPGVNVHILDPKNRVIPSNNVPGKLVVQWTKENQIFQKYWDNLHANNEARVTPELFMPFAIDKVEDGRVLPKDKNTLKKPQRTLVRSKSLGNNWFKTGDMAMRGEEGEWYILGRASVDILKVAGHLVSALEIEREILALPEIAEAIVVGMERDSIGHIPVAIVKLKPEYAEKYNNPTPPETDGDADYIKKYQKGFKASLSARMAERVSPEKKPRRWIVTDEIPRNAMGKVNKKAILHDPAFFPTEQPASVPEGRDEAEEEEDTVNKTNNEQ